jgi:predicted transposase YdaD
MHMYNEMRSQIFGNKRLVVNMGKWDLSMKNLFYEAPEDIVTFILKDAQFVRLVSPVLAGKEIFCDILCEIRINGRKALLHIEFQKKRDGKMAERLWKYNMDATIKYKCPVWSCVIYLAKDSTVAEVFSKNFPDGRAIHRFNFSVIKMWDVPTEELLCTGRSGLAPLLVLTQNGQRPEVIEQAITLLDPSDGNRKSELLTLTYGLASLILVDQADQDWLKRRFNMLYEILKDTPAFRDIAEYGRSEGLKKGRQEGLQQGLQEGLQQGGAENLHLAIVSVVEARFSDPILVEQVRARVANINDLVILRDLVGKVALLATPEGVGPLLTEYEQRAKKQAAKKVAARPRKKKVTE